VTESPCPPLPKLRLPEIVHRRQWVGEILGKGLSQGEEVTAAVVRYLAVELNTASNDELSFEAVFETLIQYRGQRFDTGFVELLAAQIAGRYDEIRQGALALYSRPERKEWVALEIQQLVPCVWRDNRPGQQITLYALNGHPAGHTLVQRVPESWLSFLAYRIGFTKRYRYPEEPWMLTGLRLWGYIVPADDASLVFEQWQICKPMKEWNSLALRRRLRYCRPREAPEADQCPFDFEIECNECQKRRTECPAAINP
jgi:hypothetical protein